MTHSPPPNNVRHRFVDLLSTSGGTWFDRLLVPALLLLAVLFTGGRILSGDWLAVLVSAVGIALMVALAGVKPLQQALLRQEFTRSHAFYIAVFWVHSQLWLFVLRLLNATPAFGKDSRFFYVFLILFIVISLRLLLSLFALTPIGYRAFMSKLPFWEQTLVALNEFVSAGLLAFVLGGELARLLQPDVFTLRIDPLYSVGLIASTWIYFMAIQVMWLDSGNRWLSKSRVWLFWARVLSPVALFVATLVIVRHFTNLSEPRTANLLGTANIDQTILALSPVVWMMILFMILLVYTSWRGLRQRFLPDELLKELPDRLASRLATVSDMDILMILALLMTVIPLQLFLFQDSAVIGSLQEQLTQQNALIDSSEQALALIFALPFYVLAVGLLALYASVMVRPGVSSQTRNNFVEKLPITLLIIFIITLYLCAIPFSQVLTSGRIPNLQQDLGYILAFDVLIPLLLLYSHYVVLVRIPYGRGQSRWRKNHASRLENRIRAIDSELNRLQQQIKDAETAWAQRDTLGSSQEARIEMLYRLIDLNGRRDGLVRERLNMVTQQQELSAISDAPVSLTVARLPARVFSLGIPLILAFKVYEWAIVNDGLREVANNPNIGVIEFFQTILENTNF